MSMNARPPKIHLRCALRPDPAPVPPPPPQAGLRPMTRSDIDRLGSLLFAAYRGTVDDEGETEAEAVAVVRSTFDGEYGAMIPEASLLLEDAGELVSASFVTLWRGGPLLAFAVTHPDRQGQGLSRLCTRAAMQALARAGHTELHLFVTETNAPARALYERLGFETVPA
jgi:GNAT superfamily N-acetyltransferase